MTIRAFISAHLNGGNIITVINGEYDTVVYNGAVANVPNYLASIAEVDSAMFTRRASGGNSIIIVVTIK